MKDYHVSKSKTSNIYLAHNRDLYQDQDYVLMIFTNKQTGSLNYLIRYTFKRIKNKFIIYDKEFEGVYASIHTIMNDIKRFKTYEIEININGVYENFDVFSLLKEHYNIDNEFP
jgi:hypothetical protein